MSISNHVAVVGVEPSTREPAVLSLPASGPVCASSNHDTFGKHEGFEIVGNHVLDFFW
jgi:hypothetical protein